MLVFLKLISSLILYYIYFLQVERYVKHLKTYSVSVVLPNALGAVIKQPFHLLKSGSVHDFQMTPENRRLLTTPDSGYSGPDTPL